MRKRYAFAADHCFEMTSFHLVHELGNYFNCKIIGDFIDKQSDVSENMDETVRAPRHEQPNAFHHELFESEYYIHSSAVTDDELNVDESSLESEADSESDSESEQSGNGVNIFYSFFISLRHLYKHTRFLSPLFIPLCNQICVLECRFQLRRQRQRLQPENWRAAMQKIVMTRMIAMMTRYAI